MSQRGLLITAALLIGVGLRVLGIGWGLPDQLAAGEPPFHPDEFVPYVESARLYSDPHAATFIWGGGFYMRLTWLARRLAEQLAAAPGRPAGPLGAAAGSGLSTYALTLLCLRAMNIAFAVITAACAACVARALAGARAGLATFALSLVFPGPVLDAHFARPDVLISAASAACLVLSVRALQLRSPRALFGAGIACGAAGATMLSGVIGLAPLASVVLASAFDRDARSRARVQQGLRSACIAAAGIAAGYAVCNTEALLHPSAFRAGLEIAFASHQGGSWAFPTRLLSYVPLYAFGAPAAILACVGAASLIWRGPAGSGVVLAQLGFGAVLLGRVGFDMMRHLEFLAAPAAALAGIGAVRLSGALERALRAAPGGLATPASAAVAALTLQISLGLVLPMQLDEDARYRIGRWLAENAPPGSRIGITTSFSGDQSYAPRVPSHAAWRAEVLMLKPEVDASGFLARGLDYIATSDYARDRARGPSAQHFVRELFAEGSYRLAATAGPSAGPPLLIADLLTQRQPADLSYTRATFFIFERRPAATQPAAQTSRPRP